MELPLLGRLQVPALLALVLATGWPAGAQAAARSPDPNRLVVPRSLERPPAGHRLTGRRVLALARVEPKVRSERRRGRATPVVYLKGSDRWQVSYFGPRDGRRAELAQVTVDDRSGRVTEAWTGFQVPWLMARGYPGAVSYTHLTLPTICSV